jgi:hypothetical protein
MTAQNWVNISHDTDTGIETLRAHFTGHAYDPHWHDSYLVDITQLPGVAGVKGNDGL